MEDEHTLPRLAFQEIAHRVVYRDLPLFAALRSGDRDISCQQIDLIPAETQDLTAPHARVQRELHNVRGDRVAAQEQHPDLLVREDPLRQHLLPEEPYSLHGVLLHLAPRDRQVEDAPQARELAIDRGHRDISWVPVGILPTTEYLITPVRLVLLHKLRRDVVKRPILEEGVEAFHKIAVALPGELRGLRVLHILIGQFPEPDRFFLLVQTISALEDFRRLDGQRLLRHSLARADHLPHSIALAIAIRVPDVLSLIDCHVSCPSACG